MIIQIKVKTKSQRSFIEVKDNILIAHIKSIPVKNKANEELIKLLSEYYNHLQNDIKIKSGVNSNRKFIEIPDARVSE